MARRNNDGGASADPPTSLFRFNGQPAIGLAIAMKSRNNLPEFGDTTGKEIDKAVGDLPIGVGVHQVADQPRVIEDAIGHFTRSLFEAVVIVLLVSFVSHGARAGLIVALAIPLPAAMTFIALHRFGIALLRVSTGAQCRRAGGRRQTLRHSATIMGKFAQGVEPRTDDAVDSALQEFDAALRRFSEEAEKFQARVGAAKTVGDEALTALKVGIAKVQTVHDRRLEKIKTSVSRVF